MSVRNSNTTRNSEPTSFDDIITAQPKPVVRIENWRIVRSGDRFEVVGEHLEGVVTNHPRFLPGTFVRTSTILSNDGFVAETRNTMYELGVTDVPVGDPAE